MATQYNINKYVMGQNGFGCLPSVTNYTVTLSASTAASVTVPGIEAMGALSANQYNKFIAIITADVGGVFIAFNDTAAVPAGDSFGASTSSLLPNGEPYGRYVKAGDSISVITAQDSANVSVEFYTAPF